MNMQLWNFTGDDTIITSRQLTSSHVASPQVRPMPKVKFTNEKQEIEVPHGSNLRKEAKKAGIELYPGLHKTLNCRGFGVCCSCRVYIKKGQENCSKRGWWEKLHTMTNPFGFFGRIGHEDEMRLACQTQVEGDIEVETRPQFNWHGDKFWE